MVNNQSIYNSKFRLNTIVHCFGSQTQALSEDQTGKSLSEVQRIQSEHPAAESDTVITRGRVLGGLEPSRAFGDARYKWPVGMTERLGNAFHVSVLCQTVRCV